MVYFSCLFSSKNMYSGWNFKKTFLKNIFSLMHMQILSRTNIYPKNKINKYGYDFFGGKLFLPTFKLLKGLWRRISPKMMYPPPISLGGGVMSLPPPHGMPIENWIWEKKMGDDAAASSFSLVRYNNPVLIDKVRYIRTLFHLQGVQLYMAECFWYLVKRDLSSERVYTVHWLTLETRPCFLVRLYNRIWVLKTNFISFANLLI